MSIRKIRFNDGMILTSTTLPNFEHEEKGKNLDQKM